MGNNDELKRRQELQRHMVELLRKHFFNRADRVAALMDWGKPHPLFGDELLDPLLLSHVLGRSAKPPRYKYMTKKRGLVDGAGGRFRIGSYTPTPEGLTRWLCLDFDGKGHSAPLVDAEGAVLASWKRCQELGIPGYIERSGGGHGWHLWVFFDEPVKARKAIRLARHLAPPNQLLANGEMANAAKQLGIEVFPKQECIRKEGGLGNMVWLPFYHGAKGTANQFHRLNGDTLEVYLPEELAAVSTEQFEEIVKTLPKWTKGKEGTPPPEENVRSYLGEVRSSNGSAAPSDDWKQWRSDVLERVDLESVYGQWLTGAASGDHWLECRDPDSPTGDRSPSAGVATGSGQAPRGTFHSHRTGETLSLFDFLMRYGSATDFMDAARAVADLTGVALPEVPAKKREAASGSGLPTIHINNRQFRDMLADAWDAVHRANEPPTLFRRVDSVVTLSSDQQQGRRTVSIKPLAEMGMYNRIAAVADWFRENERGIVAAPPPKDVARAMLEKPSDELGPLDAVAYAPLFDRVGNLIATPGYHRDAAIWLELPDAFPMDDIPENPTEEQVAEARTLLQDDLFVDFPFVDQSDRAHAIAALVLPFVRRMVDGCTPIHLVEAPTEGSGKGYICHAISILATGQEVDPQVLSNDENEARKLLTSELLSGRPIILLDNVDDRRQLASPSLASMITSANWSDRLLYTNDKISLPNRAVWLMTGNNPKVSMELARRCIRIRIDPKVDRPYLRDGFKHDPYLPWVKENRMALARAVLVLIRAWLSAGRPRSSKRLGSFEQWTDVIGGILETAGIDGFLGNLHELYEAADVEGETWREFVRVWWETHGEAPKKVSELNDLCEERELLLSVRGDKSPRSQQTRLGKALMNKRDRVFSGVRIVRLGSKGKDNCIHYALVNTEPPQPADADSEARTSPTHENLGTEVPPHSSQPHSPAVPGNGSLARTCENLFEKPEHVRVRTPDTHAGGKKNESFGETFSQVLAQVENPDKQGTSDDGTSSTQVPQVLDKVPPQPEPHTGNGEAEGPKSTPMHIDLADLAFDDDEPWNEDQCKVPDTLDRL